MTILVQKTMSSWTKLKISFIFAISASYVFAENPEVNNIPDEEGLEVVQVNSRSTPIKSDSVVVHVLDKISGKVFRSKLKLGRSVHIGTITIQLNNAFVNNPEDLDEVYANISIEEKGKAVFNNWVFASSSVNSFIHPVYEVRVES